MRWELLAAFLLCVACSGSGGAGGSGGSGGTGGAGGPSGGSGGAGAAGGFGGNGRDPGCPASSPYITQVTGSILDPSGAPIEGARAGMCLRFDVAGGEEAATCLDLIPADAAGDYVIDVPVQSRCMRRAAMQVFFFPDPPAPPTDSRLKTYCGIDLPLDGTTVALAPYVLWEAVAPTTLPPAGVTSDSRTVVFADGLEIDVTPADFFATYELLASVSLDPDAAGLCFVDAPSSLTRVFGIRPDGDVRAGVSFPVRIPNDRGLAAGTVVALYILGGLRYDLPDGTIPEEGEWVRFGSATVSTDETTISGAPLPFINWFGYGPN